MRLLRMRIERSRWGMGHPGAVGHHPERLLEPLQRPCLGSPALSSGTMARANLARIAVSSTSGTYKVQDDLEPVEWPELGHTEAEGSGPATGP